MIEAMEADKADIFDETGFFDFKEGGFPSKNDSSGIVIGEVIAEDYFDDEIKLRKKILINGESFTVVGILNEEPMAIGGTPSVIEAEPSRLVGAIRV